MPSPSSGIPFPPPIFTLTHNSLIFHIRPHHVADAPSMAQNGNSLSIALNMRNTFPSPYTLSNAEGYIVYCHDQNNWVPSGPIAVAETETGVWRGGGEMVPVNYVIVLVEGDGEEQQVIGGLGLKFMNPGDVDARNAEVGYWLGERYWGRGIMSAIVPLFTQWTWDTFPVLLRLEASVYGWNQRSGGCLRKAKFLEVATLKGKVWKAGKQTDLVVFECLRP